MTNDMIRYDNGICIRRQSDHFILSVGEQEMEIDETDVMEIAENPDAAFEIIIEKKRKYGFNASGDNFETAKHFF